LREGATRQPMRIHDPQERPLALAGLWTGRQDPESGIWHRTFTIVTTSPNEFMTPIHNRMPVVVPPDDWVRWLSSTTAAADLRPLLEPSDSWALDAYPVPPLVNNVRNNGPELVERLQPPPEPLTLL
jgi:putative SOS response-associated peptidase YedK